MIRTLVVDDDPAACRLHARYVDREPGFGVVGSVQDGPSAVEVVGRTPVDLVLLDIRLPEYSGIEVLHRLRSVTSVPVDVIVISSARDRVTVRQALSAQVSGYLVKPFSQDAFSERLQAYRARRDAALAANEDSFGQREIDALLSGRPAAIESDGGKVADVPADLPPGVSPTTLELVVALVAEHGPATATQLAEVGGVSRATARRYLEFMHGHGLVDVSHRYGRRGRPELIYRLAPTQ